MMSIMVYTNSAQTLKTLTDEITASLMGGVKVLQSHRLMNMNIEDEDADSWQTGDTTREHMLSMSLYMVHVRISFSAFSTIMSV